MDRFTELFTKLSEYSQKNETLSVVQNERMSEHSSFKIGGAARIFACPENIKALSFVCDEARKAGVRIYILGKGTNVLFSDDGFDGAVISLSGINGIDACENSLICGAGASLTAVSRAALENSLCGMSFAYGIPGSIGGAVYMNAGAYNGEISGVLKESTYLDLNSLETYKLSHEDHEFAYRHSSYKNHPERIIVSAKFELKKGNMSEIKAEMDDFMSRRREKQPLEFPSAGSVFKRYPGRYTAQMIDEAGLKGAFVGGAAVSEKHAGFIINRGGATCKDVLCLIDLIKKKIKEKNGIDIETEVIYVE